MNEHELERIAAAAHALRPDWPLPSIKTILSAPQLANRPRRDVAVALAWIACESNTATPKRVLENGPWWRAVMVEESNNGHRHTTKVYGFNEGDPRHICGICGLERSECERRAAVNGHEFVPRTDCLPPTEPGALGERLTCLAGLPDDPCKLRAGHKGQHHTDADPTAEPEPAEESADA